MTEAGDVLISMKGIERVFYTDEVETHALSGIDLEICKGEYVSIEGPSGSGKSTLLSIIGLLDSPTQGQYLLKRETVENLGLSRARHCSQPRDWFYLPKLQPHWRSDGVRKRRAPLDLSIHERPRMQAACKTGLGASGDEPPHEALPVSTFRRPATAGSRGAGAGGTTIDLAGRRTDGQSRFAKRERCDGIVASIARGGRDHLHGHPRPPLRAACRTRYSPA